MVDELLTHDEVARYLRRTPKALHQLRHRGAAPVAYRIAGGKLLYRRSDVEEWLNAQREQNPPQTACR